MTYDAEVLADSPWAYYKFLESGITKLVADSSGNARSGLANQQFSAYRKPPLAPGLQTSVLIGGQWVDLPPGLTGSSFSFEIWWMPNILNGINDIFSVDGENRLIRSGDSGIPTGKLQVHLTGATSSAPTTDYAENVPQHMVITYDAATGVNKVYNNGALSWQVTQGAADFLGTNPRLFWGNNGGRQLKAYVSAVSFYKSVLTAARVLAHWNAGSDVTGIGVGGLTAKVYNTAASISWQPYAGATYEYRIDGGAPTSTGSTPSAVLTGLTNATTYNVEVRATINSVAGAWTSVSVTPVDVYFFDEFNRADVAAGASAIGTSTDGKAWTTAAGTWGISSGRAFGGTGENVIVRAAAFNVDLSAYIPDERQWFLVFRYKDINNFWVAEYSGASVMRVYRKLGGGYTQWTTNLVDPVPTIGIMRVVCLDTMIYVYYDGVLRFEIQDEVSIPSTDTLAGLRVTDSAARVEWVYAKAPAAVGTTPGYIDTGGYVVPAVPPDPATSWAYKGRDTKTLDTVGAS